MGDKDNLSPNSRLSVEDEDFSSSESDAPQSRGKAKGSSATGGGSESHGKPTVPMQKRRRVTRACDECRRKKIKCDGKQPCTHCTVYSYECTYDQPSNRRRNPAPQYIEALEQRLQKAEAILHAVMPGIDLDDPKYEARGVDQIIESNRARLNARPPQQEKADDDGEIQPMVERVGTLDLDDSGNWDFHGHSSGFAFMRKFRAQFGEQFLPTPKPRFNPKNRNISQVLESPRSAESSPFGGNLSTGSIDLPSREAAIELCRSSLDDCCALMRPLHRPTFFRRLHSIYETDPDHYTNEQMKFLPLLYMVMALGFLFSKVEDGSTMLDVNGYTEAMEQGYRFLDASKSMLDITDCRDLITLQTVFFMVLFLQSTARLATCYAYIGIALRACCRLGLHRNLPNQKFGTVELDERKRIFWLVRKMDTYVSGMLGLPQMLSDEEIDQEFPAEVHDDCITEEGISPVPKGSPFPLMKATNAHTKLTFIFRKVVRYVYPIKGMNKTSVDETYTISHARIRELERDLQVWMDELPVELRPSDNASLELSRVQQLLRMSYAHVQMMMYRSFIHYVSQVSQQEKTDKRSFACAAACVSVARNIVHITSEMKRRGLLVGAYWFVMYTTYFAIISLVYFVLENPNSPTGGDILKDALEGRDTLAGLAKRSMAADRCTESLASLFNELPEKLKERRNTSNPPSTKGRKRPAPTTESVQTPHNHSTPNIAPSREGTATPSRARTLPHDYLAKIAKRNSMPDPAGHETGQQPIQNPHLINMNSPLSTSPLSQFNDFTPQLGHTQIPDLKNVMFPSDNPFAYPNQPISTLEGVDPQYSGYLDPSSAIESPFTATPTDASLMGTPGMINSGVDQQQRPSSFVPQQHYDAATLQRIYEENPQLASHLAHQQQRQQQQQQRHYSQVSTPMSGGFSHDVAGQQHHNMFDMSQQSPAVASQADDYWNQMSKVNIPTRSGFTPGGAVNLEDLFGGGGAWGTEALWEAQGFPRQ